MHFRLDLSLVELERLAFDETYGIAATSSAEIGGLLPVFGVFWCRARRQSGVLPPLSAMMQSLIV